MRILLQVGLKVRDVHFSTYPVEDFIQLRATLNTLLTGSNVSTPRHVGHCTAAALTRQHCQIMLAYIDPYGHPE